MRAAGPRRRWKVFAVLALVAVYVARHPAEDAAGSAGRKPAPAAGEAAACPVHGTVSSPWGRAGGFHDGVDVAAPVGTPIHAVTAGTVTVSITADPRGYGQYVNVAHRDGSTGQYGHMSRRLVHAGDRVRAGQVIALVGVSGRVTGPHLHLRIYPAGPTGRGVDPVRWLRVRGVTLPC